MADIEVVRKGKVRRAKLYFLRDRVGKATRLKEVRQPTRKEQAGEEAGRRPDADVEPAGDEADAEGEA